MSRKLTLISLVLVATFLTGCGHYYQKPTVQDDKLAIDPKSFKESFHRIPK